MSQEEMIRGIVREELRPLVREIRQIGQSVMRAGSDDATVYDIDGLAGLLGKSRKTVYGWRHRGTGPKETGKGKYLLSDVKTWLEEKGMDALGKAMMDRAKKSG
jgi:predicted DNA-binding transcriptional regulator AlpA